MRYERRCAALYIAYARLHPRTSPERRKLFEEGYWFTMDIEEFHSKYLSANYFTPLSFIRLAGLVDQPLPKNEDPNAKPAELKTLINQIPEPIELMTESFLEDVAGPDKGKAVEFGQEDRPKCLFFFAESWFRQAQGSYDRADAAAASDNADERMRADEWRKQAERMVGACDKALDQIANGEESIVGPVPDWLQKKADLEIRVPLRILKASRSLKRDQEQGALENLAMARTLCEELILNPDQSWAGEAKKHLVVVDAMAKRWNLDLGESAGAVIAEADRIYSRYIDLKNRPPRKRSDRADWQARVDALLAEMRDAYLKAIRLIEMHETLSKRIKADYTAKCWYQVGLANLYLGNLYESFLANQYVLQIFPVDKYGPAAYPGVEQYRKYASKNVVASTARQRRISREKAGGIVPFDGKLYAWSLIWRIRYETAVMARDTQGGLMEEGDDLKGSVKDFFWVIAKEMERIQRYEDAYEWYSRAPEASRLSRLAHLMRGQVALKQAQEDWREAKRLERELRRLATSGDMERYEETARRRLERQTAGDEWAQRSLTDANTYIKLIRESQEKYPDLANLPNEKRHLRRTFEQERNALYGAVLLIMQSRFNAAETLGREEKAALRAAEEAREAGQDPAPHLAKAREAAEAKKPLYAEVRKLWPVFQGVEIRADNAGEIRMKAGFMQLVSLLESVDFEDAPPAELKARLDEAEPLVQLIARESEAARAADSEATQNPMAIRAPLYIGQKWMGLARRVEESDPAQYETYRLKAGEMFSGAIGVVEQSLKFGLMVGDIFTDMELYDKAEEVYELALKYWDTEERQAELKLPSRQRAATMVRNAFTFYSLHGGTERAEEMKEHYFELANLVAPQDERPEFYAGRAKIKEIRELHETIRKENPDDQLLRNADFSPKLKEIQEFLAHTDDALDYQSDMERVKRNLVLAKVDMGKWPEALSLLEDLLATDKWNKTYRLLRGEVHVARAEAAEAWSPEVKEDIGIAEEVSFALTSKRPAQGEPDRRAGRGSPTWWDAVALNYRAKAVEFLLRQDERDQPIGKGEGENKKTLATEAARAMKHIRMFQTGPQYSPTEDFKEATDTIYNKLAEAGYVEMGLTPEKIKELQEQADARVQVVEDAARKRDEKARADRRDLMRKLREHENTVKEAKKYFANFPEQIPIYRKEYPEEINEWLGLPGEEAVQETGDAGAGAGTAPAGAENGAGTDGTDGAPEGEAPADDAPAPDADTTTETTDDA